jgi:hypothetical protein
MKKFSTLAAMAAFTLGSLAAQAQFTVDGSLGTGEVGTGTGKYQLVGTYTNSHTTADRGLKALYVGTTATTLNVLVVASPETTNYQALALYLDMPNKTGIAAGTQLPGGDDGTSQLRSKPTLDMPVDYAFRMTTSPLGTGGSTTYYSKLDYTGTPNTAGTYQDKYLGPAGKTGAPLVITDATTNLVDARFAFQTSTSGSVSANTTSGWEFQIPLASLGGAAAGTNFRMMVAFVNDDATFTAETLPQIAGQTAALGTNPNFANIAGGQNYTYQVGTGVLATRSVGAPLHAAAYPNPLAADSRLLYTVADQTQPVTVEALNSLGQRAALLLDAAPQAPGEHSLALAPLQRLAPGVYLVRVQAGSQLTSQRVVVN